MPFLLLKIGMPRRKLDELLIGTMVVAFALVQCRNPRHLIVGQGKVQDVQIVTDMVHIPAAGDYSEAHLGMPAEDDLRGSLSVLLPEVCKYRFILQRLVAVSQRIPAHQLDAVLI